MSGTIPTQAPTYQNIWKMQMENQISNIQLKKIHNNSINRTSPFQFSSILMKSPYGRKTTLWVKIRMSEIMCITWFEFHVVLTFFVSPELLIGQVISSLPTWTHLQEKKTFQRKTLNVFFLSTPHHIVITPCCTRDDIFHLLYKIAPSIPSCISLNPGTSRTKVVHLLSNQEDLSFLLQFLADRVLLDVQAFQPLHPSEEGEVGGDVEKIQNQQKMVNLYCCLWSFVLKICSVLPLFRYQFLAPSITKSLLWADFWKR